MSLAGMFLWRCPEFAVERHGRYFERTIRDNHRVSGDAASKGYICKLTGNTKGMCRGTCLFWRQNISNSTISGKLMYSFITDML